MKSALAILLLLTSPAFCDDAKLPDGYTCADVREKVKEYGWVVAYGWAKVQGYSKEQIAQAKKCLR